MGAAHARVDVAALVAVAGHYEAAADAVDTAVRTHLSALTFDGAVAGRAYGARGDALRNAIDDVVSSLRTWAVAATGIAGQMRAAAQSYTEADARAASRLL